MTFEELSADAFRIWMLAKATKDEFHGVDATHLSKQDRRDLAACGLSFAEDRNHRAVASYPARLRQQDLRNKVTKAKTF